MIPTTHLKRLHPDATLPKRQTAGAAAYDVFAYLEGRDVTFYRGDTEKGVSRAVHGAITIQPFERAVVPLGFSGELPEGWEASPRPRGSVPTKRGLLIANSPGTIDEDYRGEWFISMLNTNPDQAITICHGQAIAQVRFQPAYRMDLVEVDELLTVTARGAGALGSTGR